MRGYAFKSLVALAVVLAFNQGLRAAPSTDDEADTQLVNPTTKTESFGVRMQKARAAKQKSGGVKTPRVKHAKAAKDKAPRIPRAPKIAKIGD